MNTVNVETVTVTKTERVVVEPTTTRVVVTGIMGPPGRSNISSAGDIDKTTLADGATLVYSVDTEKWVATNTLENITINAGFF